VSAPGDPLPCPLCLRADPRPVGTGDGRLYGDCRACGLIHLHPAHHPTPEAERAHYRTHENDPGDPGYREFLSRLADPLLERLDPGAEGLDYGAGPGPTLSVMLAERGHPTAIYDPFFHPDRAVLDRSYEFVTCSETAEHFHRPREELARLCSLLRPGGILAVMTVMYPGAEPAGGDFEGWWYRRDPTHVSFYRPRTFEWIAEWLGWTAELPRPNVALLHRPGRPRSP
jgi:SAM-dependent methyltransferase